MPYVLLVDQTHQQKVLICFRGWFIVDICEVHLPACIDVGSNRRRQASPNFDVLKLSGS